MQAAEALGLLGDQRAVERLLELIEDEDGEVRIKAAEALWHIAWKNKIKVRVP
jgi:HEAT repeat protein